MVYSKKLKSINKASLLLITCLTIGGILAPSSNVFAQDSTSIINAQTTQLAKDNDYLDKITNAYDQTEEEYSAHINSLTTFQARADWSLVNGWWQLPGFNVNNVDVNVTLKAGNTVVLTKSFPKTSQESNVGVVDAVPSGYSMDKSDQYYGGFDGQNDNYRIRGSQLTTNGQGVMNVTINVTKDGGEDPNPPVDPEEPTNSEDRYSVYRVYNPNNGEHLYTLSNAEARGLINVGWQDEGISWYAGRTIGNITYRLYNPNSGEHFYTQNESEYNSVGNAGWKKEDTAFYASNDTSTPIYRIFNPNARDAGSHHYTVNLSEQDGLISGGWKNENTAFYSK